MPRLTEQEQQEIVRFIEAGRPFPDKYRFLLFDEKREVELVWNGKTSEVCNIVLPFQVSGHRAGRRAACRKGHALADGPVFAGRARTSTQGMDEQVDLGRQQAYPLFPQKRPAAR